MELQFDLSDKYDSLLPQVELIEEKNGVKKSWWKIDQTISQLSYLTHGFFRYYGKFPSTIASFLLTKYPCPQNGCLLDNFAGSGTSLVEAARRGIPAIGIDINPISGLSGKVKTTIYKPIQLESELRLIEEIYFNKNIHIKCDNIPDNIFIDKWFFKETINDIIRLKGTIIHLQEKIEFDFFSLAFLSIIRRISKAYDGEVRPHLNKNKKIKDPFTFFKKKCQEMIESVEELRENYPSTITSETILADTRTDYSNKLPNLHYWLIISHPPYLNCFDYIPVFKLELEWSYGFNNIWGTETLKQIKELELKSWPANEKTTLSYYEGLKESYTITHKIQEQGDKLAIIIGDCTIKGKLEPVHVKLIDIVTKIGYKLIELNYRTTNYSTGKYAYQKRADYDTAEKRDAILIFEKV